MRKLKLFSLALMALFSVSLWATDPTLPANATPSGTLDILTGDAAIATTFNTISNSKKYLTYDLGSEIRTNAVKNKKANWVAAPANDGGSSVSSITFADGVTDAEKYGFATSSLYKWGINSGRYVGFRIKNCTQVAVSTKSNSTKDGKTLQLQVYIKNEAAWDYVETIGADTYNNSKAYVLTTSAMDGDEEYVVLLTSANSSNSESYEIRFTSTTICTDPESSIIADQDGYVGDTIDLEFLTLNTSAKDTVVKIGEAAAVAGTDYEFIAEGFKAKKAGEFEITISQVKDATYCAVEESVTLSISATTPISAVEVKGPATARIGEEVTLTAVADNGIDTIYWTLNGTLQDEEHSSTLTFTPNAEGNYTYAAFVRNQFNTADQWISDDTTVVVAISSDAKLSDLKVNGTTVAGFTPTTTDYNIGEIGVYEKLTITYTVNDEGYASATLKQANIKDGKDTVVVTAEDGTTVNNYIISFTRAAATELVSISGSTTWDWTNAGSKLDDWSATSFPAKDVDTVNLADVPGINNNENFKADALLFKGQGANRGGYAQGPLFIFRTTVAGKIVVTFSNTGTSDRPYRYVAVNGVVDTTVGSKNTTKVPSAEIDVNAGLVKIEGSFEEYNNNPQYLAVSKITFTATQPTALDNTEANVKAVKRLENGMLVIEKNGVRYNAMGQAIH